jgi:hypothetical protein
MPYPNPRPAAPSGPGTCPHCRQPVLWTITTNGRQQPIDPEPDPTGRVAVYQDPPGRYRSRQLTTDRPTPEHAEVLYTAHAATCTHPQPRPPRQPRRRTGIRPHQWQR